MRDFYRALFPRSRHMVLGRELQPFSLWHLAQLNATGTSLNFEGPTAVADLAACVAICCSRYPERVRPPQGFREIVRYRLALRLARFNLVPELSRFRDYLRDHTSTPKMFTRSSGKKCQCPGPLAMWAALVRRGRLTKAEAWNEPLGIGSWEKVALAEADGVQIDLLTDEARAAMIAAGYRHLLDEEDRS